ncbi:MAG: hypothetical protein D3926_25055 [Desulfobacteraceae bacterium]|nr:MAG: hypothetical protein D3926_25055 [Desulfobacteraceae bacterium]
MCNPYSLELMIKERQHDIESEVRNNRLRSMHRRSKRPVKGREPIRILALKRRLCLWIGNQLIQAGRWIKKWGDSSAVGCPQLN